MLHGYKPTFDAAILEMMLAIGAGATLAVAPREAFGGRALEEFVVRTRRHSHVGPLQPYSTRWLRSGSIRSRWWQSVAMCSHLPPRVRGVARARMLNAYGPTECTVVTTVAEVDHRVTIGVPLAGIGAEVLDTRLRPVPWAGIGELCTSAGPGLRWAMPEIVPAPPRRSSQHPVGHRRYRTGDLVHRRTDDTLGFVGRSDRQMSVRGIRVEPAEIESALRRCTGVEAAAVVLVDGHCGCMCGRRWCGGGSADNRVGRDVACVSDARPRGRIGVDPAHDERKTGRRCVAAPCVREPGARCSSDGFGGTRHRCHVGTRVRKFRRSAQPVRIRW